MPPTPLRAPAAALAFVLAAGPALAQFGPQGPPAVGIVTADRRPITETTEFVGRIESTDRVGLRARVSGFIQEIAFREGQEVEQGQVLYRLERAPFEAEVARQQASIASAQATLTNARISLDRARDLLRTPAGTQARVDDAVAAERTGAAQLLGAQAALRAAQINLDYTEIAAPIAGRIGRTNFTLGNVVGLDSGALATIVSQDPMRVAFPISARQAGELRTRFEARGGADAVRVRVRFSDGTMYPEPGRVVFIDPSVDRNTDTLLVRALIPNPLRQAGSNSPEVGDRPLVDGQFVSVLMEGAEPVQAIAIPRAAVLQDQQGSYVFILDAENKAQRRNVTLGRGPADTAVIERGLEGGERVVAEGVQRVRPGQPVNPAPVSAPPPTPGASPPAGGRG
ncbi:efflux RND transporter periplasmic adaptor subunit [Plastoroseomonas hellenica]|uniref:Efflux RND transporter periplasmic adaptor subunit n=1 Tax=Plastoroseomonas hellenica TaxID=2687306 RepID=A0ABS5F3M2_9PROT|nr:efflux RND transporter periplasmic adaptor subunit [Plastoroseomonas hellenica]MBR0647358.1 efflux RND transporter periplasmic adaptor subunit [Plastoroseomonas hellenica]MBR0667159.1 efflux RND transporter periplasmic adaptor subunit [Plastoroseomonas hellenica]